MANQSTFAAPQKADNWRAVVGSKLPDGTTDVTEGIYHDGAVHLGDSKTTTNTRSEHLGIVSYIGNGNFISQVLQTTIPKDSLAMPAIYLRGYDYTSGDTVDVQISLYTYNVPSGSILNTVWQSKGTSSPATIKAGWNASNLLALEVVWPTARYFNRYQVGAYSDGPSGNQTDAMFENWVITNAVFDASVTQVVTLVKKNAPAGTLPFATPAETVAGTSTTTIVNPADLYARENIAAQTGLGLALSAIPAPTASQSNWGVNTLGETLHYMPGVGWKIVANLAGFTLPAYATVPTNTLNNSLNIIAPRAGRMTVSAYISALLNGTPSAPKFIFVAINKGSIRFADNAESTVNNASDAGATGTFDVLAGDVINIIYWNSNGGGTASTLYSWQYEA